MLFFLQKLIDLELPKILFSFFCFRTQTGNVVEVEEVMWGRIIQLFIGSRKFLTVSPGFIHLFMFSLIKDFWMPPM